MHEIQQMIELIKYINSFQKLDAKTEQAIRNYFIKETFNKNEFILEEGKICKKISFIKSGLVRRFYINEGKDVTEWIYYDHQWLTSTASFIRQKPSLEYLQACEETELYSLTYSDEQKLLEYPLFAKFHIKLLRNFVASFNEFRHTYNLMPTPEKYKFLLSNFPEIIQRGKLKHVASMLDISQETLSRIRSSIY